MFTRSPYIAKSLFRPGTMARNFHTSRDLIVTQQVNTNDCTRASIATILNHLAKQKIASISGVNDFLLERCAEYRSRNIDGLQPALETKAAIDLFKKHGFFAQRMNLDSSMLINRVELEKLMFPLQNGLILASTQPPGNPSTLGHSVVITDVFYNDVAKELNVGIFDPYPMRDRDSNGRRTLSIHDILGVDLNALIYVSSNETRN
ncbi:putative Peptidase_C39_2 domain-containing protein [Pseudomonas sp. IT-232MI5]|uniref:hypothetical protein n=1 Tax=Pseudomonas sp. IT-232MI5 TaxID=3026442 RepID=UPI0039E00764